MTSARAPVSGVDFFLSHASKDQEVALDVLASLERRGAKCWIAPRDIQPGADWGAAIVGGIRACDLFLLIFSAAANESDHVLREVDRAVEMKKTIVPIRIGSVEPSDAMDYRLCTVQWLDAASLPVPSEVIDRTVALLGRDLTTSVAPATAGTVTGGRDRDANIARQASPDDQRPPRRGSGRADLYRRFWTRYLERVRAEHPQWTRARKPSERHWMSAPGPIPGTLLMPAFHKDGRIGHELYIDTGDADSSKQVYRRLHDARQVIEEAYGAPLQWLELTDRRASRVLEEVSGSIEDVDRHDQFLDWFVERGERLRQALDVYLSGDAAPIVEAPTKNAQKTFAEVLAAGSVDARELDRRLEEWAGQNGHSYEVAAASRGLLVDGHLLGRLYPQWDVFALRLKTLMKAGASDEAAQVRGILAEIQPDSVAAVEPNLSCDVAIEDWDFVVQELLPTFARMLEALPPKS